MSAWCLVQHSLLCQHLHGNLTTEDWVLPVKYNFNFSAGWMRVVFRLCRCFVLPSCVLIHHVTVETSYRVFICNCHFLYLSEGHLKTKKSYNPIIFVNLIYRHFDILRSHYGQVKKKSCLSGLCQNSVTAAYCKG